MVWGDLGWVMGGESTRWAEPAESGMEREAIRLPLSHSGKFRETAVSRVVCVCVVTAPVIFAPAGEIPSCEVSKVKNSW